MTQHSSLSPDHALEAGLGALGPSQPQSSVLVAAGGLELRRAVLAVLLRAQGPMRISEIVGCLHDVEQVDVDWIAARARHFAPLDLGRTQPTAAKVVADLLRHQVAYGRVIRVWRALTRSIRPVCRDPWPTGV